MLGETQIVVRNQVDPLGQAHLPKQTATPQRRKRRRKARLELVARVHA
jgi:hypothetical protein